MKSSMINIAWPENMGICRCYSTIQDPLIDVNYFSWSALTHSKSYFRRPVDSSKMLQSRRLLDHAIGGKDDENYEPIGTI
jgi:hypothetical protein